MVSTHCHYFEVIYELAFWFERFILRSLSYDLGCAIEPYIKLTLPRSLVEEHQLRPSSHTFIADF